MAASRQGPNRQLIAAIILVVIAGIAWVIVRQHEARVILAGDASGCWTASCRDAVIQRNMDRTTGRAAPSPEAR